LEQIPFPLLRLPTELIEIVCDILKAQNRQKSLATLNVANKYLRDVTTRFLWESVRWTPRTWCPEVYGGDQMPQGFAYTQLVHLRLLTGCTHTILIHRYIMLVSPNGPVNEYDENGWACGDGEFWLPLFAMPNKDEVLTFGQRVHKFFPNLKYVVALSALAIKTKQRKSPAKSPHVSAYISDQNLLQKHDATALRRMIFESLRAIQYGKDAPNAFSNIKNASVAPIFRAAKSNWATFEEELTALKLDLAEGDLSKDPNMEMSWCRSFSEYQPFRNRSSMVIDGVEIGLQMLTTTDPEAFCQEWRGKTLDLFFMTMRLLIEDGVTYGMERPKLVLDIDYTYNAVPMIDLFEYLTEWLDDVSADDSATSSVC
jgi:hypothetical protein